MYNFSEPPNHELLGEINVKMCIIEKSKKHSKNLKLIFSGTV